MPETKNELKYLIELKSNQSTLKISRSSGILVVVVVTPAESCLEVGITSIGLIDIMVESTTPPVEGILFFYEMSNPLFYFFFLLVFSYLFRNQRRHF
jgi:hypothetical protein